MPHLSIITVNKNNAAGLEKTISSVLEQTWRDFQFIVIDGASTDASPAVLKRYADNMDFCISKPDSGPFQAMNRGIEQAKGQYCLFLNSGDILAASNVLEKVFTDKKHIAPFISGNQINNFGDKTTVSKNRGRHLTPYDFYCGTIKHQATFIRRDLFDIYGGYDESLKVVADWKFFFKAIGIDNLQPEYVDIDIVNFEWNGISTSEQWQELHSKERLQVLLELLPKAVLPDYESLMRLNNYRFVADKMERSRFYSFIVRFFAKLVK
jgi:glycosyltransferase involved in cell wall biosynthesis